MLNKIS